MTITRFKNALIKYLLGTLQRFSFLPGKLNFHIHNMRRIMEEISRIEKEHPFEGKKIVVFGKNRWGRFFAKQIQKEKIHLWGILSVDENEGSLQIDDLLYENFEDIFIYIIDEYKALKTVSVLYDMGIENQSIKVLGNDYFSSSRLFDTYDANLGLCWQTPYGGFEVFEDQSRSGKPYVIVTLGGSTSDPFLANLKSWSKYLFESLNNMGINVKVYSGGVACYTVTQELNKLIRDVIHIKPDIVISYSGVNDLKCEVTTYFNNYPFVLAYQADILEKTINAGLIKNGLQFTNQKVSKLAYGVEQKDFINTHWLECEKMMHAICKEFDIGFIAFLQPYNKDWYGEKNYGNDAYFAVKQKVNELELDWLIDFGDIFNGEEKIYMDSCHVYEKGNRIIARKMLPFVMKYMERCCNEDNGNISIIS